MADSGCPVNHQGDVPKKQETSACPVNHDDVETLDPKNNMPSDLSHKQKRAPGQVKPLSTERMKSNIPREEEGSVWEYPSPQMFYNAMKRKGWRPNEDDMDVVVAIHNAVNERAWVQLLKWEHAFHSDCEAGPKLVSIKGLSKTLSPKAKIYSMLGYGAPFDRHDWIIDRCGVQVRYVIDYYNDKAPKGKVAGLYMDVRPALDSATSFWDRTKMMAKFE